MRHAQFAAPMTLIEELRKRIAQWREFIKKADTADADRMVSTGPQTLNQICLLEDASLGAGCFAAGKSGRKQALWPGRRSRRWKKSREEGVMRGISKTAGGMPHFPAAWKKTGKVRGQPALERVPGNVEAQGVKREENNVVAAHDPVHVRHGKALGNPRPCR